MSVLSAPRIGLRLESLKLPLRTGIEEAGRLGVSGLQMDAQGDLAPQRLSQSGRRELLHLLRSRELNLTALGCPLRRTLGDATNLEPRIDRIRAVMSLAAELGAKVVSVSAGRVPADDDQPAAGWFAEALTTLARHGDRVGAVLALETGQEPGDILAHYLRRFDTGGLGANLDPAELLTHGFDPYAGASALGSLVVQVRARDVRLRGSGHIGREVPLGEGDIDWMQLLATLEEIEYSGWLTLVRTDAAQPARELAAGVALLRRLGV